MAENCREFRYSLENHQIVINVEIPFTDDIDELVQRALQEIDLLYLDEAQEMAIKREMRQFIMNNNEAFWVKQDEMALEKALKGEVDVEKTVRHLEKHYKEELLEFAERKGPSDEEIFAQSFHRLVHSPALPKIIEKEREYAKIIADMTSRMEREIEALNVRHQREMDEKIDQLDKTTTSEDVNRLLSQQYAAQNLLRKKWESELEAYRGYQKHDYRDWIIEETLSNTAVGTPVGSHSSSIFATQSVSMEESFTILLGSQMKHNHNIRIFAARIYEDLCSPLHSDESFSGLNMALGLYSAALSGIVVLVNSGSVKTNETILKNANRSTEFHFDQVGDQIEKIQQDLNKLIAGVTANGDQQQQHQSEELYARLKPGDFFITRHSNLSQSHLIFHLISDEAFFTNEINSRHPVILGLRNILKVANRHDVTTLTIPGLLRSDMSEDMTVPWCMRRAELVFKCAKGFMIESASWGGTELSTLQLLLPHDISEELFTSISAIIPTVFRVANAKILQENKSTNN